MKLGELFYELGFKADQMKLNDFVRSVGQLNMQSLLSVGSLGVLVNKINGLIKDTGEATIGINRFGRETGQSRVELQKWATVAESMGASQDTIVAGVKTLQDQILAMQATGEASNIWSFIGDPRKKKDIFEVLKMVGESLVGMDASWKRRILSELGLSDEWMNILPQIVNNYDELNAQLAISEEQLNKMVEFHKINMEFANNLKVIFADIGISLIASHKHIMEWANGLLKILAISQEWKGALLVIEETTKRIFSKQMPKHVVRGWKGIANEFVQALSGMGPVSGQGFMKSAGQFRSSLFGGFGGGNKASNTTHIRTNAPITINGSDPVKIGKEVQAAIMKMNSDTATQFNAGGF